MEFQNRVDPMCTALLVVDVQNDFCHENGYLGKRGANLDAVQEMVPYLERIVCEAKKQNVRIIFIRSSHSDATDSPSRLEANDVRGICYPGSWGMDGYRLQPSEKDDIVIKHRYDAFIGTDLNMILHSQGITNVIVTGVNTNICVDSTARSAAMLDFFVSVPEDCCSTSTGPGDHEAALRLLDGRFASVTTSDAIIATWLK